MVLIELMVYRLDKNITPMKTINTVSFFALSLRLFKEDLPQIQFFVFINFLILLKFIKFITWI